ncbi:Choline/Carnitine o-acyltransferase [Nesidiocoris tenuis]|uniref:Choline O-acetyltransferase n=1 Tax=Nesidiocoris tenuis TaxID=355587 RepID=A0ABN7A710_9HEMI|nr:Choline/Carnitine o-acyltransferase [Nesidiocoris tenuis]
MGRYLDNLKPLLTESQFEKTRLLVQEFADPDGPGPKVQAELLSRREAMDNWAYDWWMKDMYTGIPLCLPINVSPGMVFPPRQLRGFTDIARYGARIINGLSQYKDKLDRREIPQERATSREKGQPLCMAQYYRLMTSYRVPGAEIDTIISTEPEGPSTDRHVIVACRNKFYALYLKRNGSVLSEEEIAGHILHILESKTEVLVPAIGLLTAQPRNIWAENRETLLKYEENRECMKLIENSIGLLCLDQNPLGDAFQRRGPARGARGMTAGTRDETNIAHQMLHGGGSVLNTANRWFDKTIQLIIGIDGVSGLCYEHSQSEAVAVLAVIENILDSCASLEPNDEPLVSANSALAELKWTEPPQLNRIINEAARFIDNLIDDLDFYVYRFDGYGKNFIKSCNCSPDAYIQMALQLAYYKLYGKLTATYESASTRRFHLGRVDCIRSATWETLQWVSAMAQSDGDPLNPTKRVTFSLIADSEKLALFDTAMKKQTEIMVDNILGQGVDIHLLGLKEQSKLMDMPMKLFNDESFRKINHFSLSTSQVATKSGFMGYGPVVPDGYGASYNIFGDHVIFCISAFYSSQMTSSPRFAQSLEEALSAMQSLHQTRPPP